MAHSKPWHDRWQPRNGHTISLKLGLQPEPPGNAGYASWQGGDFTKNDDTQGQAALLPGRRDPHDQHGSDGP